MIRPAKIQCRPESNGSSPSGREGEHHERMYSPNRRYVFSIHGRSERFRHWQHRQERRQGRRQVYQAQPGQQPEFARIIGHENLLRAYDKLRSEGGARRASTA